jgi:hypothetical protein
MIRVKGNLFVRFRGVGLGDSDERVPPIHGSLPAFARWQAPSFSNECVCLYPANGKHRQYCNLFQVNQEGLTFSGHGRLLVSARPDIDCFTL